MRKYLLSTPHGDRYYIHEDGAIEREDGKNGDGNASSWRLHALAPVGPHTRRAGARWVSFDDIGRWLITEPPIRFKNGKPLYTVCDIDHGTMRTWGSGLASIRLLDQIPKAQRLLQNNLPVGIDKP